MFLPHPRVCYKFPPLRGQKRAGTRRVNISSDRASWGSVQLCQRCLVLDKWCLVSPLRSQVANFPSLNCEKTGAKSPFSPFYWDPKCQGGREERKQKIEHILQPPQAVACSGFPVLHQVSAEIPNSEASPRLAESLASSYTVTCCFSCSSTSPCLPSYPPPSSLWLCWESFSTCSSEKLESLNWKEGRWPGGEWGDPPPPKNISGLCWLSILPLCWIKQRRKPEEDWEWQTAWIRRKGTAKRSNRKLRDPSGHFGAKVGQNSFLPHEYLSYSYRGMLHRARPYTYLGKGVLLVRHSSGKL